MPRPRFDKLPPVRRAALLEAAAHEFSAHGYEDASMNHILEMAGVSKGAAYYYFDDKEDLFLTVILHYLDDLGVTNLEEMPETVTAETFWPRLREVYRRTFVKTPDHPWAFGVWRAAGEVFRARPNGPLAQFVDQYIAVLARLLKRGQELGVLRTDLPDDLLMAWVRAVDDTHDRWILEHWAELDNDALSAAVDRVVDGLRRLVGVREGLS
jgi:AcrR family transcriptional regulator